MVRGQEHQTFGRIRTIFWPIHSFELKIILPMFFILFFICVDYSILRNLKDSLIITAKSSGAEVIPFVKVWFMLPMAFIMTWIFTRLCQRYNREKVFYLMSSGFLFYYLFFAFVIYPFRDHLHPHLTCDWLELHLPKGFHGFIAMIRYWTYSSFYAMCDLWASAILSVLFWGFANEIIRLGQAKRFYGILNVASNLAAFVAGQIGIGFAQEQLNRYIPMGTTPWEQTFYSLILLVSVAGIISILLFRYIHSKVLIDKSLFPEGISENFSPKKKKQASLRKSFSYLANSKYLICLAVLIVGYNLCIHLSEVIWKAGVREIHPDPNTFNHYLNQMTSYMGLISTVTAIFIPIIIHRIGWSFLALLTPIIMLTTSIGFFFFFFLGDWLSAFSVAVFNMTPLGVAVLFGSANNVLSKAAKYSFLDASKEFAFIPLNQEARLKGKAAIDGIGSRLGKSGGSIIYQVLLMSCGSLMAAAPWIAIILMSMIGFWIYASISLGKQFSLITKPAPAANIEQTPSYETASAPFFGETTPQEVKTLS